MEYDERQKLNPCTPCFLCPFFLTGLNWCYRTDAGNLLAQVFNVDAKFRKEDAAAFRRSPQMLLLFFSQRLWLRDTFLVFFFLDFFFSSRGNVWKYILYSCFAIAFWPLHLEEIVYLESHLTSRTVFRFLWDKTERK